MNNLNIHPPFFGPQLPVYPHLLQLCRVTAATVPGPAGVFQPAGSSFPGPTLYVSFTEQLQTGSLIPRDREPCLVDDVNGTGLTPGYYLCRLAGSFNGLPVYEAVCCAAGSFNPNAPITFGGPVTFSTTVTFNSTTTYGTTVNVNVSPPGTLSKPTQLVTGTPKWIPPQPYTTFPLLWGAFDHIEWEWDGLLREPTGSSTTPGMQGWTPFVSVGRTPVNDANYGPCSTTDRIIAYTAISAPRVVTLPLANSMPPGFALRVMDESGSASAANTISVQRSGSDQINDSSSNLVVVSTAFGAGTVVTNGVSDWTVKQYPTTGTTSTYGVATLGVPYSLTGTMLSTGLTLAIPSAGVYFIFATVSGNETAPSATEIHYYNIKLLTAGVSVWTPDVVGFSSEYGGSMFPVLWTTTANQIVILSGGDTLELQAYSASAAGQIDGGSGFPPTLIGYIKLA